MHMVDLYLSMQSCVRDADGNLYYNGMDGKRQFIGILENYEVVDGTLEITIKSEPNVQFVNVKVIVSE